MTDNTQINGYGLIWITGFSASGKTTVSRKVHHQLKEKGYQTIFLDGDDLRSILGNNWGFDKESRIELAHVYFRLCSHLCSQGYIVIISAIAMFDDLSKWVSNNIPNAMQVYLNVPQDERLSRDAQTKKIFVNSKLNDDYYEIPMHANLKINNFGKTSPDESATIISYTFIDKILSGKSADLDRGRKPHWDSYYKKSVAPINPSPFAESVLSEISKDHELLEIGSGNGRDAAYFASNGIRVTAIDRSEAAIAHCKREYLTLTANFIAGTMNDYFTDHFKETFDIIYSRFVIHAMPLEEEIETLKIASALLKRGGKVFIECRSINDPLSRKGEIISATERVHGHYRRFIILDDFKERLEAHGLKVITELESDGLAVYKDDNPVVIRISAEKLSSQ